MAQEIIVPPWTPEQVKALNDSQTIGIMHPFTCGICRDNLGVRDADGSYNDRILVARMDGWYCPTCGYTQRWAYEAQTREWNFP